MSLYGILTYMRRRSNNNVGENMFDARAPARFWWLLHSRWIVFALKWNEWKEEEKKNAEQEIFISSVRVSFLYLMRYYYCYYFISSSAIVSIANGRTTARRFLLLLIYTHSGQFLFSFFTNRKWKWYDRRLGLLFHSMHSCFGDDIGDGGDGNSGLTAGQRDALKHARTHSFHCAT